MFDNKCFSFQSVPAPDENPSGQEHAHQYNQALDKFKLTLLKGVVSRLKRRILNRPRRLYDLNALKLDLHLRGSCYAGIQVVPIRLSD